LVLMERETARSLDLVASLLYSSSTCGPHSTVLRGMVHPGVSFLTFPIHIELKLTALVINSEIFDSNTRALGQASVSYDNLGFDATNY